jgi:hypothetical protein
MANQTIWKMGQCVMAANRYDDEHCGCKFYVVRILNPKSENDINYCVPCAYFKESNQEGQKINNHCFLTKNEKIIDPMFHKYNINIQEYIKFLATKIDYTNPLLVFDIQELAEIHRKHNRSQFITDYPYFGIMLNTRTNEISNL